MRIDTITALCLGLLIEILSLWEIARREHGKSVTLPHLPSWLTPERLVMIALLVVGGITVGVLRLGGIKEMNYAVQDAILQAIGIPIGLFAFFYGLINPFLLPRVNEQTLFVVYVTMIVGTYLGGELPLESPWLLGGAGVVGALLFWFSVSKHALPPGLKAVSYLIYLGGLTWVGYQQVSTFPGVYELTPFYSFALGISAVFYMLHILFLMRFFLILSSMLIPTHWRYLPPIMSRLFGDTENSPKESLLSLGSALGLMLFNELTGALPVSLLLGFVVPLIVQVLNTVNQLRAHATAQRA